MSQKCKFWYTPLYHFRLEYTQNLPLSGKLLHLGRVQRILEK